MFKLTKLGHAVGSGSPKYLKGGYDVTVHTVGSVKYAITASFIDDRVCIYSLADPANPSIVGSVAVNQPAKVRCFDDGANSYAVVTSFEDDAVKVIDITTPASPSVIGTLSGTGSPNYLDGAYGLDLAEILSNWYAFATSITDNRLVIIDLATPTPASPALEAVIGGSGSPNYADGCHDVYVAEISNNWYAFVISQDDDSLSVYDMEIPGSPVLVDSIQGIGGAHSICGYGNYVYISANSDNELVVADVTTPSSVSVVGTVAINKPMGVYYKELLGKKFIFVASFTDDAIRVVNVDVPTNPQIVGSIAGSGLPNYLDGIHAVVADDDYAYAISYNDNALGIFEIDADYSSPSATIAIQSEATCKLTKSEAKSLSATIAIESYGTCKLTGGSDWSDIIGKPHWVPKRRCFIQDSGGDWIDITDKVADFGTVNWQIEDMDGKNAFNVFTANNCQLTLKNEDEEFDFDKASNYFTSIGQPQDGKKVPVRISAGYVIDGVESLIDVFYGLIIDIDTSTDDDQVTIDLQCVSRVLRDAKCYNIGYRCVNVQLTGGETYAEITKPIGIDTRYIEARIKEGTFPQAGYAKISDDEGNEEIFYYGQKTDYGFAYCIRGVKGTETPARNEYWSVGTRIDCLLADGNETDERYFQFPVFPIVMDSVESVTSSDGTIIIVNDRDVALGLSAEERKLTGYIDYKNGLLELGAKPTDPSSIYATYRACPRMETYHGLSKWLLEDEGLDPSEIDDCTLSDRDGNHISYIYGHVAVALNSSGNAVLMPNTECLAVAVDDNNVWMGVGSYLVQWDGDSWKAVATVGIDKNIARLGISSSGSVFGIARPNDADDYGWVFKYDEQELTFLSDQVAAYLNLEDGLEGSQFKGFSVDDTNEVVWFLYHDTTKGLAKIGFDGSGYTKYARDAEYDRGMDLVDSGNDIEFFYYEIITGTGYLQYDTLSKSAGTWSQHGNIKSWSDEAAKAMVPIDVVYNESEDKIYLNILKVVRSTYYDFWGDWWDDLVQWLSIAEQDPLLGDWSGWFVSVPRGSVTETDIEIYDINEDKTHKSRYCGGVYHNGYVWYVRGSGRSYGAYDYDDLEPYEDLANGHLYRIDAVGGIEDMGTLAYKPPIEDRHYLRENVMGIGAVMAVRESDDAIFFISTDATVNNDPDYGYALGVYAQSFMPVIRKADLGERTKWDIMSECAKLSGFELGVTRDGKIFFRQRTADRAFLSAGINDSVTTIPSSGDGMDDMEDSGIIQIDSELITYSGKTADSFTGCVRGASDSIPASHNALATIFKVDDVLITLPDDKTIKRVNSKTPNYEEIYNYVIVKYGNYEAVCNYVTTGEVWEGSSEQLYGRRELRVDNTFLTDDDVAIAKALAWRYYDLFNQRHSRVEFETTFQPQIDLGDSISIKQPSRTILDYALTRIRTIQMEIGSFYIRCIATVKPNMYRESINSYPYQ